MENEKIIVGFMQIKNVVIANVVNTPVDTIGSGTIIEDEWFCIKSVNYRDLNSLALYLHGKTDNNHPRLVAHAYENVEEAKNAIEGFKSLIAIYNSQLSERAGVNFAWERAE